MAMGLEAAGAYLRVYRDARKLSQDEVADALGVTGKQVSNWERGIHDPKSSFLAALLRLFGASSDDVVQLLTSPQAGAEEGERLARQALEVERLSKSQQQAITDAASEGLAEEDVEWIANQLRERMRVRAAARGVKPPRE